MSELWKLYRHQYCGRHHILYYAKCQMLLGLPPWLAGCIWKRPQRQGIRGLRGLNLHRFAPTFWGIRFAPVHDCLQKHKPCSVAPQSCQRCQCCQPASSDMTGIPALAHRMGPSASCLSGSCSCLPMHTLQTIPRPGLSFP